MPSVLGVILPSAASLLKLVPDDALGALESPRYVRYRVSVADEYLDVSAVCTRKTRPFFVFFMNESYTNRSNFKDKLPTLKSQGIRRENEVISNKIGR